MKTRLKIIVCSLASAAALLYLVIGGHAQITVATTQPALTTAQQNALNGVQAAFATDQTLQSQAQAQIAQLQQAASTATTRPAQHFGVNLEGVTYYNRMPLFADAMLQASGPIPTTQPSATVMVFSGATPNYAGNYTFQCTGQPTLALTASPGSIQNQTYNAATNTTTATISVTAAQIAAFAQFGPPQMQLQIGSIVSGAVSNVHLWRPGYAQVGQRFTNEFVKLLAPFDTVRFMDALNTNGSTQINWTDRPLATDQNYSARGMCFEDCFALCRQAGKAPWICLPTQVTPAYLSSFIALAQQQAGPGPVYVEWGNEIWNSAFPQWAQAVALAKADTTLAYDGTTDPNILLYRWMGKQAVLVGKTAMAAYGVSDIRLCPIRPMLCGQWGNSQVLQYALQYIASQYGPPNQFIYGIAIAPYATLSNAMFARIATNDPTVTEQQIVADYAANGIANASLANSGTAAFVAQAKQYSLHTRAYEFGFDSAQAQTDVTQKTAAAHDPAMGPVLTSYVNNWWAAGCEGLNWYTLTAVDSSNGQWGLTVDAYNPTADPKYVAATQAATATLTTH